MKKRTICKAPQKCTDCRAYVTRSIEYNSESGFDCDVWDECAFGYVKHHEQLTGHPHEIMGEQIANAMQIMNGKFAPGDEPTAEQLSEALGIYMSAAGLNTKQVMINVTERVQTMEESRGKIACVAAYENILELTYVTDDGLKTIKYQVQTDESGNIIKYEEVQNE